MKVEGGFLTAEVKIPISTLYKGEKGKLVAPWSTHKGNVTLRVDGKDQIYTVVMRVGTEFLPGTSGGRSSSKKEVIQIG